MGEPTTSDVIEALEGLGARVEQDDDGEVVFVSLWNAGITDTNLEHLSNLPNLESLDLSGNRELTDAGLGHLTGLTNLEQLNLYRCEKITDAGLEHLGNLTSLEKLNLGTCLRLTDAGLEYLRSLTNLEELYLTGTRVTTEGMERLHRALPKWPGYVCRFESDEEGWLLELRFLVPATDELLAQFRGETKLRVLHLWGEGMTDAGLEHLKGLVSLEWLSLDNTQVSDAGLEHLEGFTNLRCVWLRSTQVTDKGATKLQQALPNCRIQR